MNPTVTDPEILEELRSVLRESDGMLVRNDSEAENLRALIDNLQGGLDEARKQNQISDVWIGQIETKITILRNRIASWELSKKTAELSDEGEQDALRAQRQAEFERNKKKIDELAAAAEDPARFAESAKQRWKHYPIPSKPRDEDLEEAKKVGQRVKGIFAAVKS